MEHARPESWVLVATAFLVLSAGCSKKADEATPSPTPPSAPSAAVAPAAPSAAPAPQPEKPHWGAAAAAKGLSGTLSIQPNPVPICPKTGLGMATVSWTANGPGVIEIRVTDPEGGLLTRSGSQGSAKTGPWVQKGTVFLLQDGSDGVPRTLDHTLARLEVTDVVDGPCK
jgi:hypothetical protein